MSNGLKEKLIILGGGVSLAALICGVGLLLRSSGTSAAQEQPAKTEGAEKTSHGASAKKAESAHGASSSEGHGAEKKSEATSEHGAASKGAHGAPAKESAHGGGGGHGAAAEGKAAPVSVGGLAVTTLPVRKEITEDSCEPEMWCSKGDSAMACARYDDAVRYYDLAVKKGPQDRRVEFKLRHADAIRLSPSLPAQLREQKALEIYSSVLAENPKSETADHAQFKVGVCLSAQGRWQEAMEALNRYAKNFPVGIHSDEVRFRRAETLSILGNPDEAGEILEKLIANERDLERKSRAVLLLARVKLQLARTDTRTRDQALPETHREEIQERPPKTGKQVDDPSTLEGSSENSRSEQAPAGQAKPVAVRQALPAPQGIPEAQWATIRRYVEIGNLKEAQRLIKPWLENDKDQAQHAPIWVSWARLLKDVAERGALDVPMDGILITSRAE